jgi:flagellar hook-basal body complex protein FliE
MPITPIANELVQQLPSLGSLGKGESIPSEGGGGLPFADVLKDAVATANMRAQEASKVANAFAAGTSDDIHGTMIAVKEADIELKLVANVRSKLVDAFNDLWKMSI